MSIHFHSLKIKTIKKETADCVSVVFDIPTHLENTFKFKQGQSLTMKININGVEVRRTYSICSSPFDNELKVAIKKIADGKFSVFANDILKKGDEIDVMEPVGNFFTDLNPSNKNNYLAFAAGSGITPILSLIKTTLAEERKSTFTLVFGNKTRNSIIFFEELEGLKNKYMHRFNLIHILSRENTDTVLNFGRINIEKLKDLQKIINYSTFNEFFICGPEEMIFDTRDFLFAHGIEEKKIHFELFNSTAIKKLQVKNKPLQKKSLAQTNITIKVDGRSVEFEQPLNSDTTILDAALKEGLDLPFACKGGMCCTCKAKLVEGEVDMDVHWGLEHSEIERGYILTCQSHPKTEKIIVDFDIK